MALIAFSMNYNKSKLSTTFIRSNQPGGKLRTDKMPYTKQFNLKSFT